MSDNSDAHDQLLVAGASEAWDDIEGHVPRGPGDDDDGRGKRRAAAAATAPAAPDAATLVSRCSPAELVEFLRTRGVLRVGTFEVDQDLVLQAVGTDKTFLTLAASTRDLPDPEGTWRRELERRAAGSGGGGAASGLGQRQRRRARPGAASAAAVAPSAAAWSRVTAEAFVVNVRDAGAPDVDGLVHALLRRYQAGALSFSAFALPSVQAILQYKWHTFAKKLLLAEFAIYAVWLVSFSAFAILWQDEDPAASLAQLVATRSGLWTVALELVASICMIPFLAIEVGTIRAYGLAGWFGVWNALDTATYVCQAAICYLHLSRVGADSGWLSIVVAFQSVCLWTRLNYFSRLFGQSSFSFSFVDSLRAVVRDTAAYMAFLVLLLWGFALSFAVLFRREQEGFEQFASVGRSLLTVFGFALGGVDLDIMSHAHNPRAALCLGLLLQFSVSILLMSLLTGSMCASFGRATEHEDQRVLLSLATVIDELEATMPPRVERALAGAFAARPPFIHVLRIRAGGGGGGGGGVGGGVGGGGGGEEDEDDDDEAGDWRVSRRGKGGGGGSGGDDDAAAVRRELAALRRQVQALHDTLSLAVPSLPPSPPQVLPPPQAQGGKGGGWRR
jgi:hypothetical protein